MSFARFCRRAPARLNPDMSLPEPLEPLTPAAVLVPVIDRRRGAQILLTRRPATMADHGGQIAFPGGKVDSADADLASAALREAREEVGLAPDLARIIGRGGSIRTTTGFHIFPVVALISADFAPVPHPREVAELFEVPLDFLMQSDNCHSRMVPWRHQRVPSYVYDYHGRHIWGATARIIKALSALVFSED